MHVDIIRDMQRVGATENDLERLFKSENIYEAYKNSELSSDAYSYILSAMSKCGKVF